ncbi:EAL domain-containing response regulator [Halomonas urmiana]|uniref:EAL domain-containing response regulator n=1 Tax=Halomonas urmiana TaxID=490901 RepID=A0A5R8MLF5_9GAMM|nr:EAL domain-containing response regulator [Halomonas urmiana]TLF52998.1 EAL domain-containing response regulator [Halomonas urmiana]
MNDLTMQASRLAVVLEEDPDAAATLSLQLRTLGMDSRYCRQGQHLIGEVVARRPHLVIMALEFGQHDGFAMLRRLAESGYRGRVLLLSGVERKIVRIAERLGQALGLSMLPSLDKPMRLSELRRRLEAPAADGEPDALHPCRLEELDRAFARQEITLHYQPQFELTTGRLSGVAARLHLSGLEVSVDDFGVGFSSLARLQLLPISELKVDRSFVSRLLEDPQDAAIVEAVALLGRRLGIRVVAEGIEDLACLPTLERFGCTHVQGFGLGRPMPAVEILALAGAQSPIRASSATSGASPGSTP